MQRPQNRQPRDSRPQRGRNQARSRFNGDGGRGQGGIGNGSVPNINQVIVGAFVSIVLKVDQGTSREVQGVVQDVLTTGNHPQGIKVRLLDGRVGRVQQMVSEGDAMAGSAGLSGLGENGKIGGRRGGRGRRSGRNDEDTETDMEAPKTGYSLEDFLPVGNPLRDDGPTKLDSEGSANMASLGRNVDIHICPVCEEFEGDEAAVSHHVNSHFDDS